MVSGLVLEARSQIFLCETQSLRKVSKMVSGLVLEARSQIFRVRHSP